MLAPGDTARLRYPGAASSTDSEQRSRDGVVDNGTFVNSEYFPVLGYQDGERDHVDDDRKQAEAAATRADALDRRRGARANTQLSIDADWIEFEATVSTAPDQIAIAPGYLQREWTENGRRVFDYKMDRPIVNFSSFVSARYEVARDK